MVSLTTRPTIAVNIELWPSMQTTEGISLEVDFEFDSVYDFELFVCNSEWGELEQEAAWDVETFFEELDFDLVFDSAFDFEQDIPFDSDSEWLSESSSSSLRRPFFLAAVPVFLLVLVLLLALVLLDLMIPRDFPSFETDSSNCVR